MERKPKHSCLQQMVFKSKILGKDKTHLTYKLQCVKFHNKEAKHVSDQKLNERNCFFFFFFLRGEKVRGWIICSSNCYDEVIAKPRSKTENEK
jgi:hypothetical protein